MNKNLSVCALLLVSLVLSAMAGAADTIADTAALQRASYLQSFQRGVSIRSNRQHYQLLDGIRAVQSRPQETAQQAIARVGGGTLIETKGTYVIYAASPQAATTATRQTAYNPRTGGIGVVPGTLIVKLKRQVAAASLAAEYGLTIERVFPHLQTAVLRVKPGQDVVTAAAAVAADARVTQAEVEVIEHLNEPN